MMMSYLWGDGENSFREVGAEPPQYSIYNIKPSTSNGHLKLHEPQNQGLKELELHLLLTEEHYLF